MLPNCLKKGRKLVEKNYNSLKQIYDPAVVLKVDKNKFDKRKYTDSILFMVAELWE
jgi:hypothetical protein